MAAHHTSGRRLLTATVGRLNPRHPAHGPLGDRPVIRKAIDAAGRCGHGRLPQGRYRIASAPGLAVAAAPHGDRHRHVPDLTFTGASSIGPADAEVGTLTRARAGVTHVAGGTSTVAWLIVDPA
ncbi:hypothetical protein [Streptomyces canus]|uniref:hypothetical protein n=1 Tax=Streptomyces canus TaxID=58343 RepID=UPI00324C93CB